MNEKVETTIHAILYILKGLGGSSGFHKIFKILYFADQKHLVKYGSPISQDTYIAMQNGPVPSLAYDILKSLRGYSLSESNNEFKSYFNLIGNHEVELLKEPELENLSYSEIECINQSIKENKNLAFQKLTDKSHDNAWQNASRDGEINIIYIAKSGGASKQMLAYIKDHIENQSVTFE